jgi:hypothetical protein
MKSFTLIFIMREYHTILFNNIYARIKQHLEFTKNVNLKMMLETESKQKHIPRRVIRFVFS